MRLKDVNLYTTALFTVGLYAFFGYLLHLTTNNLLLFFVITLSIVILDFFPITLPSGLTYSSGFIGYLYFSFHYGLGASVFPLLIGTLASFLKFSRGSVVKINWFRYFSTVGMVFLSVISALLVRKIVMGLPFVANVLLAVIAYEMSNAFMHAGIRRTVMGDPVFRLLKRRLLELAIPILVATLVLSRLLTITDDTVLIIEAFYTTAFLLLIIFFSTSLIKQITLRERRIEESNHRFAILFEKSTDLIVGLDHQGTVTLCNPLAARIFGFHDDSSDQHFLHAFFQGNEHLQCKQHVEAALQGVPQNFDISMRKANGEELYLNITMTPNYEKDQTYAVFCIIKDVSEQKRSEFMLHHMAYYDALTDLPNRRFFYEKLEAEINQSRAAHQSLAVMMFDLDSFKIINDTLGHDTGDLLLQSVAKRMSSLLGTDALVARMGGDEFMVLMPNVSTRDQVQQVAMQFIGEFEDPIVIQSMELRVTTSIGIALYPDDGETLETLLKHADIAMYRSKASSKNNFKFFAPDMNSELSMRRQIELDLIQAFVHQEFALYYQPQINNHTGAVEGAEALVRWQHPEKGIISPVEFIPVAEETGSIVELGDWVLQEACEQAIRWQNQGFPPITISVNLSLRQLEDPELVSKIDRHLAETGLDPHLLILELTESIFSKDLTSTANILHELKHMGIQLAIDDFGTGYSSLSYLSKLPVDTLKLDKSFVQNIYTGSKEAEIATSVIHLAHKLGMTVVAEGVDSIDKLAFLRERQCDLTQGYFYSPPLPAAKFEQFLRDNQVMQAGFGKKSS